MPIRLRLAVAFGLAAAALFALGSWLFASGLSSAQLKTLEAAMADPDRADEMETLVDRYGELTQHAVFYLDPHVCMRCRYRSTELLWQCPHCHDWNTFVEERIAPAQDVSEVEV